MVIAIKNSRAERAMLIAELIVAMAILAIAVLPIGYSFISDARALRASYQKAVAMEIVDGEMEALAGGGWRALPEGTQTYPIRAAAAQNLPPGRFQVTRTGKHLRLEWKSDQPAGIGIIQREITVK